LRGTFLIMERLRDSKRRWSASTEKMLNAVVLGLGLAICVWAGQAFMHADPSAVTVDEEGISSIRKCPPTAGELLKEFGIVAAGRKLAWLVIAGAGLAVAGRAAPYLVPRGNNHERRKQSSCAGDANCTMLFIVATPSDDEKKRATQAQAALVYLPKQSPSF
jgi:hypothetical protein